jgi:hypothetical protein
LLIVLVGSGLHHHCRKIWTKILQLGRGIPAEAAQQLVAQPVVAVEHDAHKQQAAWKEA